MARKINTSKEKRRSKRKDRVDYTARTMAALRACERGEDIEGAFERSVQKNRELLERLSQ